MNSYAPRLSRQTKSRIHCQSALIEATPSRRFPEGNAAFTLIKLLVLVAVIASVALLTPAVHAQTVTASLGDLILGFRAAGGTGAGVNLEVDLGSVSNFYNGASSTLTLSNLVIQDLIDTYGANWGTRTDLFWGAAATDGNAQADPNGKPKSTLWATGVPGNAAPLEGSSGLQSPAATKIFGIYNGSLGSLGGATSTTNSSEAADIDNTQAGSWSVQETSGNSFGFFNPKIDGQVSSVGTLDLYELQPSSTFPRPSGTLLGTLILTQSGLSFQAGGGGNAPPVLTIAQPTDFQVFTNAGITVSGTATDASGIQGVTVNGLAAALSGGTNWSEAVTLAQGTNTFLVIATDASVNHNTATQTVHAVFAPMTDTTTPSLTIAQPTDFQVFTNAGITVSGTATDASGVQGVTVNGMAAVLSGGTNWSLAVTLSLGTNTFVVIATDASANQNTTTQTVHTVYAPTTVDTTPPSLTIAQPTDFQVFTSAGITVSGTATDTSGIQGVTVNGMAAALSGGTNWSLAVTLSLGTNTFVVIATDVSANQNTTTQTVHAVFAPVTVTPPPSLTIAQPTDFQVFTTNGITASGTATDNSGSGIQGVTVNGMAAALSGGTSWSLAVTLAQGTNTLTVIATDASVNHNMATQTVHAVFAPVMVTTPPALTIAQPTDFQVFTTNGITASGTATDASGVQSVTVNGMAAALSGGTNWSLAVTLAQGTNTLTVIATDASVNHNTATQTVHAVFAPMTVTSPLSLTIIQPTDFQTFTNAGIVVVGTASDPSGIKSVTANGAPTSLLGTNWFADITLVQGTNVITVIATDNSPAMNTATQVVHAVLGAALTSSNQPPQITAGLSVTNALLEIGSNAVVMANETNTFTVSATDPDGDLLTYHWEFGDGASTDTTFGIVSHVYTNACGPNNASVTVSDGQASTNSDLTVSIPCAMDVSHFQLQAKFKKVGSDACTIAGTLTGVPVGFSVANAVVSLDAGGATVDIQLNAKGTGTNKNGNIRFFHNKRTGVWTFTGRLKGDLKDSWATFGITSETVIDSAVTFPVLLMIHSDTVETFNAELPLSYRNSSGTSGTARLLP